MTTCVIYARWSPRRNAAECESDMLQTQMCREYAQAQGWNVKAEYADPDKSGADSDRPALWCAVASLGRGEVLLVHKLDRLARDVYLSEYIRHEAAKHGATIQSVCDQGANGDEPGAVLFRQMLQAFSAFERSQSAARTSAMMLQQQRNGSHMGGKPPYGWTSKAGRLVEVPAEQATLAKIWQWHAEGMGAHRIIGKLKAEGIPARCGKPWCVHVVHRIMNAVGRRPACLASSPQPRLE